MSTPHPKLTVTEKIGYGFGDLASNLFWQMFSIFIAKFYTDVFLLGAATMGTMLLVTRMFDSVVDPMMGMLADRTNTRWGKFRPYLLWMSVPMALTAILTFTTPSFEGTAKVVYAYLTMSLMMLAYTAINIPYSALLGVLTPDSKDRTSASSYRFVMALLPVFIIVNTAIPMVEYFGGGNANSPRGWQMTMVVYSVVAVLLFWATFALTKERVQPPPEQETSLKEDVRNLFRNLPWLVLSAVGVAALTYANIRGTVAIFYFEYTVPGGKDLFGPIMTTGAAAFIAGVMITSPMAKNQWPRSVLPVDFPPWPTVYGYFSRWTRQDIWAQINAVLVKKVRVQAGRQPEPSAAIIASQSVKTSEGGEQRGVDVHKQTAGRKRHIVVDTLGLLLVVVVHSASIQDSAGGQLTLQRLFDRIKRSIHNRWCRLKLIWADGAYAHAVTAVRSQFGWVLEIVQRLDTAKGFQILPRRWVVERSLGWLGRYRRLARDYEHTVSASEAMTYIASIRRMLKIAII